MKATKILAMAMALCMMVACSQEDAPNRTQNQKQPKEGITTLTASVEGASRSAMTDGGVFSWTEGDALWVWNGTEGVEFTYDVNSREFKGYTETIEDYAIYPYQIGHNYENGNLKVNMPAEYSHGSTNAIMLAPVNPQNPTNLVFKHLGGVMRFVVKDVPVGATAFVFTAKDKAITGEFEVSENADGKEVINAGTTANNNNSVTITFNALATPQDMVFYVPLPVGNYSGYSVAIKKGTETISDNNESQSVANSIKRRTLLLMPSFTCEGNSITKGENNTVKLEAQEQSLNLSGSAEEVLVEVPATAEDGEKAVLNVNFTPEAPESGSESENPVLTISDGNSGPSTESEAEVVVTMPESTNAPESIIVPDLKIEAPTLTVTLASGTYGTVTAKTATETLIVKSGVTIETLNVEGGKLEVEEGAIIKNDYNQPPTESGITTLEDLKFAFGEGGTYELGADIALDANLTVSKDLALDFGGHTLDMGSYTLQVASGKTLTLSNSGTQGGASGSGDIITASESANIYIGRNVNLTSSENCCVFIPKGAEDVTVETAGNLCVTGGNYAPLYVNGLVESGTIRVKGGKVEHKTNTAVYAAGQVNLTIEGDVQVTGVTGVEIRAGRLDVNGGTITATGNPFAASANGNGSTSVGAAIAVCQHTTNYPLYANIYGGTFTGVRALYEEDLQDTNIDNIGLNVKGGTFDGEIVSENCTGFVYGGTFTNWDMMKYWADGAIVTMAKGEYTLPVQLNPDKKTKTITIKGEGVETVLKGATNSNATYPGNYADNMKLKFENLKHVTANNGYNGGFGHAASVDFTNCIIEGQFYAQSYAPHTFYGCTIDPLNGYLYTYASDCTFTKCTFSASQGKALQIYEDGTTGENKVVISECKFIAAKQATTWDGKPVTGIDINSNGAKFDVTIKDCTTEGFPTGLQSGSSLYNIKCDTKYVTLVIDGETIYTAE